jgi:hypothetical protein
MASLPEHIADVHTSTHGDTQLIEVWVDDDSVAAQAEMYGVLGTGSDQAAEEIATGAVWEVLRGIEGATDASTDSQVEIHSGLSVSL